MFTFHRSTHHSLTHEDGITNTDPSTATPFFVMVLCMWCLQTWRSLQVSLRRKDLSVWNRLLESRGNQATNTVDSVSLWPVIHFIQARGRQVALGQCITIMCLDHISSAMQASYGHFVLFKRFSRGRVWIKKSIMRLLSEFYGYFIPRLMSNEAIQKSSWEPLGFEEDDGPVVSGCGDLCLLPMTPMVRSAEPAPSRRSCIVAGD